MNIGHLMHFKRIFIGIGIPILGVSMIGASFLAPSSMRDVLLALGGGFIGQIVLFFEHIIELKNKVSEATKKAIAAFLLGWDLSEFFMYTTSYNAEEFVDIVDKTYEYVAMELEVLGLHTAGDILGLLKEFRTASEKPKDASRELDLVLDQTKVILARFDPPLNYVFHFGVKFRAGQQILVQMDVKDGEKVLQLLERYSKNIRSNKLHSDFYKEVIDKAINIFMEEIDKKSRSEFKISDTQKAIDFVQEKRKKLMQY